MPNNWRLYAQATLKIEQRFAPYFVGVIKDFRERFISDLQYHGESYAMSELSQRNAQDGLTPIMQSVYRVAGLLGARTQARELRASLTARDRAQLRGKAFTITMQTKAAPLGRSEGWINSVINYLKFHMVKLVQKINETMRQDIVNILKKATDNQWSISQTIEALRDEGLILARAQVIARTEVNRAANVGHATAAKDTPYEVNKKWLGAGDHRERHSHMHTNGHIVDEFGYFEVPVMKGNVQIGMDHMQQPGDPNAHVSNTANCRCRALYEPKRDAEGRLIMRQVNVAPVVPMARPTTYTPAQIAAELKANMTITVGE